MLNKLPGGLGEKPGLRTTDLSDIPGSVTCLWFRAFLNTFPSLPTNVTWTGHY